MTAIIAVKRPDGAFLMTDGAAYRPDGTIGEIGPKVLMFPHLPGAIATRGSKEFLRGLMATQVNGLSTFDELIEILPTAAKVADDFAKPLAVFGVNEGKSELVAVGWSKAKEAPAIYYLTTHDTHVRDHQGELVDIEAFKPVEWPAPYLGELPPDDIAAEFGFGLPVAAEDFDPYQHGKAWMQCRRRDKGALGFHAVGGFIQLTTLYPAGVDSRIIHTWPDKIDQPIQPR